jgi:transcription antitermination factor NusG
MATNLIPVAARMPYPIIVLDGFGQNPVNSAAHTLLVTNEGREITINAEPYDRFSGKRPEAIIPLPPAGEPRIPRNVTRFTAGQQVRVVRAPFAHKVGVIEALSPEAVAFPSGLRLPAARVEFSDGNKELVPLANIEVLG